MKDKSLFQLSFPLLLNALVGMVVMLVDMMIISSYSEDAAAAVSIANQILLVAFDLSALLAAGAVVMVSRSLGADDPEEAKRMAEAAMVGNAFVSLALGAIILLTATHLLSAINCPEKIFVDATTYLRVGAFTILFNGVMMAATSTLRGYGETRIILFLGVIAYAVYLLSAYCMIFGKGPLPELGVFGSALATLIVRASAVIALLFVFARKLKLIPAFWRHTLVEQKLRIKKLFDLSWPGAFDNLAYGFYQMILVSYIATFSVAMLLSRTFTLTLTAVLTVVLMSISQANEVMVGYRHGGNRPKEINPCIFRSSLISTLLTTAFAILLYLFAGPLISLFTDQPRIHELAKQLLWLTIFVQPFSAVNTILFHSLKTMGDVVVPVAGTQIMMWCLSVPVAYYLAVKMQLGVVGLWYVLIMEEALKAAFLLIRWRYRPASPAEA
ncbi:MAG: siderophore biosynthesis protein [Verrucomicrobiales bacterium]|nr:siderophore biosynthesis protein [Verrucomicrobiales bacterium]